MLWNFFVFSLHFNYVEIFFLKQHEQESKNYHKAKIDQDVIIDIILNRILSEQIYDQFEFLYHLCSQLQNKLLNLLKHSKPINWFLFYKLVFSTFNERIFEEFHDNLKVLIASSIIIVSLRNT